MSTVVLWLMGGFGVLLMLGGLTGAVVAWRGRGSEGLAPVEEEAQTPSLSDVLAAEVKQGERLLAEAEPHRLTTGALIDDFFERGNAWVKRVRLALYERREDALTERWAEPSALWYAGRPMLGDNDEFQQCVIRPLSEMLVLLREIQREAARR